MLQVRMCRGNQEAEVANQMAFKEGPPGTPRTLPNADGGRFAVLKLLYHSEETTSAIKE